LFLLYVFVFINTWNNKYSGKDRIWGGTKILGGNAPECPPWLHAWLRSTTRS